MDLRHSQVDDRDVIGPRLKQPQGLASTGGTIAVDSMSAQRPLDEPPNGFLIVDHKRAKRRGIHRYCRERVGHGGSARKLDTRRSAGDTYRAIGRVLTRYETKSA